ncbi:AAA family ATPase [Pseudoclavibacter sp. JSM 162008]|uniref:AAA family ATPase n=1 Tax=Pseudoclavibacter sp. JSM 162008 TaxID=3229855 RepID=UPI0035247D15
MSELRELTSIDLRDRIRNASRPAKEEDAAAWELLTELIEEQCTAVESDRLTARRRWLLEAIEVTGFRGVNSTSTLRVDSSRRLTVVYGVNGTGKSSITEALRLALEGTRSARHISDGKRVSGLWVPTSDLNANAREGSVQVTLRDDPTREQLRITARLDGDGLVTRTAVLSGEKSETLIEADDKDWDGWRAATRASLPVIAYADLADELQKQTHLKDWLTSCLAMGSDTLAFDATVISQEKSAREANSAIAGALDLSREMIAAIDASTPDHVRADTPEVDWTPPTTLEELGEWQLKNGLLPTKTADESVEAEQVTTLLNHLSKTHQAGLSWLGAAETLAFDANIADSLTRLADNVATGATHPNDAPCPVCGSVDTGWQEHLRVVAQRLAELRTLREALQRALVQCEALVIGPLTAAQRIHKHGGAPDENFQVPIESITDFIRRQRDGVQADTSITETIATLNSWARTSEAATYLARAVELSGRRHRWLLQRWEAVAEFLNVFEANIAVAGTLVNAKRAKTLWDTTLRGIRKGRAERLQELVGDAVAALLEDAGITLNELEVAKGKAELKLVDRLGKPLDLAHLSAGQRNALILGPVLATTRTGMFGFALIDDPVHAFDELRVDKLAARLNDISHETTLLLTTHDGRFVEYLRAHSGGDFAELRAQRSDEGTVVLTPRGDPSTELLDFCGKLLGSPDSLPVQPITGQGVNSNDRRLVTEGTLGLADVAALMRLAVDEGFESVARRHLARVPLEDRASDRARFDGANTTKQRQAALKSLLAGPGDEYQLSKLNAAWSRLAGHVKVFNHGAHPDAPEFEVADLQQALRETRIGLTELADIRW